jgi:hypothetical protein
METKEQKEIRRLLQLEQSSPQKVISVSVNGKQICDVIWKLPNGKNHRDFGPAVEFENGKIAWYQNGSIHREDGPALINLDGSVSYWIHGRPYRDKRHWIIELKK